LVIVLLSFNKQQPIGTFERLDPSVNALIGANPSIEEIAKGYAWTEGPLWIEEKKMLLFSDIPNNRIMKWTKEKGAEVYLTPSGYTGTRFRGGETGSNALLLNSKKQLVMCQHGDRRMALMDAPLDDPKPKFITLADNYQGKKLDSPNDAAFRKNGDLYFTDPPYGLEKNINDPLKEAKYQGVYRLAANGKLSLLVDTITRPNGIAFMPDQKSIIIANSDSAKPFWYIYDVNGDGSLANGRIFQVAKSGPGGGGDGFKIDSKGNVFATGPGGIWIMNKTGKVIGKIKINRTVSNCSFADKEKTLYVSADKTILKITLR
jgi:gluconolactonase